MAGAVIGWRRFGRREHLVERDRARDGSRLMGPSGAGNSGKHGAPAKDRNGAGCERPVQITERSGKLLELMLGAVVVAKDRVRRAGHSLLRGRRRDGPFPPDVVDAIRRSISAMAWPICARRAFVRRGRQLTFELACARACRFERAAARDHAGLARRRRAALAGHFVHPLLNSGILVDQALAGVAHSRSTSCRCLLS